MKNFIWDFDGTLFDTYTHTVTLLHRYMAERGRRYDYGALYAVCREHMGKARAFCGADEAEWAEFFRREAELDTPPLARPYEGTETVLSEILARGGSNFLYTHRDNVSIKYLIKFDLYKYFAGFVTRENGFPQNPAPEANLYQLAQVRLEPAETIMIGDREIDILSGKNAGIHTCLFTDGNPGAAASEAEYTAGNMADLQALFLK